MTNEVPANGLLKYSVAQLANAAKVQSERYSWNFFNEREFMENLMCQRFNFLLVFYSIFVAAAASATSQDFFIAVMLMGSVLTLMIWLMIWRAFVKFRIAIRICYRLEFSAIDIVDEETKLRKDRLFPVNDLLAIWIPMVCFLSLVAGAALGACGVLQVANPTVG